MDLFAAFVAGLYWICNKLRHTFLCSHKMPLTLKWKCKIQCGLEKFALPTLLSLMQCKDCKELIWDIVCYI